jgi:ankyrin repeat protein
MEFFLPTEPLSDDVNVAHLIASPQRSEQAKVKGNDNRGGGGGGNFMGGVYFGGGAFNPTQFRVNDRFGVVRYEIVLFRDRSMVQVYAVHSHGRAYYRSLVYTTDVNYTLRELQAKKEEEKQEKGKYAYWSYYAAANQRRYEAMDEAFKQNSNLTTEDRTINIRSLVISRQVKPIDFLNIKFEVQPGSLEKFVPVHLLHGILPDSLLSLYNWYQDIFRPGSKLTQLRGYQKPSLVKDTSPHVIVVELVPSNLPTFGTQAKWFATVTKRFLKGSATEHDLVLLNGLCAPQDSDLFSLTQLFCRLDNLSHVLIWSKAKRGEKYFVDLVELPRRGLSFSAREVDGQMRLYSVELPTLYVYNPTSWPEEILRLLSGIPHALVMVSDTQQIMVLVPNVAIERPDARNLFTTEVALYRNMESWNQKVSAQYFSYEVHISKQFLITTSLGSTLYLLLLRLMARNYEDAFTLIDSVNTDRPFTNEEEQIFKALGPLAKDPSPDSNACFVKLTLQLKDGPIAFTSPFEDLDQAYGYITKLSRVSARCRLSIKQELSLMEICYTMIAKEDPTTEIETVLFNYRKFLLERVALMDGTESKPVEPENLPTSSNASGEEEKDKRPAYTISPHQAARKSWYAHTDIKKVVDITPETWDQYSLEYERRTDAMGWQKVVEYFINVSRGGYNVTSGSGFLFIYEMLSKALELNEGPKSHRFTIASILVPMYTDIQAAHPLAWFINTIARNIPLIDQQGIPQFIDTRTERQKENSSLLRVKPENDEDAATMMFPLGEFLHQFLGWVQENNTNNRIMWPLYRDLPADKHLVDPNERLGYGVFGRQSTGMMVSDTGRSLRSILSLPLPRIKELGDPPSISQDKFFLQPLSQFLTATVAFEERNTLRTKLGYEISSHPQIKGHPIAANTVARIEEDMNEYSQTRSVFRMFQLKTIGAQLKPEVLPIDEALKFVTQLRANLKQLQVQDSAYVDKAIKYLTSAANWTGNDDELSKPAPKISADKWENIRRDRYISSLFRTSGHESAIKFSFMVTTILSSDDFKEWSQINKYIDPEAQKSLMQLLIMTLLHANRVGQLNRVIADCDKLLRLLNSLKREVSATNKSANSITVLMTGTTNLANSIASQLHDGRFYIDSKSLDFDPRLLVFEFLRNILLRERQVQIVNDFLNALRPENLEAAKENPELLRSLGQQMLMGQGKTAIITPLLCLMLADAKNIPIVVLPDSLLDAGRRILLSTFASIINKRVYTFTCSRAATVNARDVVWIRNAINNKGIIISTPSSLKSLPLKFLENVISLEDDISLQMQAKRPRNPLSKKARAELENRTKVWCTILNLFRSGVLLMDELDWIVHPLKSELNFPIRHKVPLDFWDKRWALPLHVMDAVFCALTTQVPPGRLQDNKHAFDCIRRLSDVFQEGFAIDALQRRPHLVLLNHEFYRTKVMPAIAEWTLLLLQSEHIGTAAGISPSRLSDFIQNAQHDEDLKQMINELTADEVKMLNLARHWLTIFLPYIMKKVDRVTFGMMTDKYFKDAIDKEPLMARSRTRLAIPFIGKDVPSPTAEFAQPDITIGLTILGYQYEGLRMSLDFQDIFKNLLERFHNENGPHEKRPSSILYSSWVREAGGEILGMSRRSDRSEEARVKLLLEHSFLFVDSSDPESSTGALGNNVWRDLSGNFRDITVPDLMASVGGHYEMWSGIPFVLAHSSPLHDLLNDNFTFTCVSHCLNDKTGKSGEKLSHIPISFGKNFCIGGGTSNLSMQLVLREGRTHTALNMVYPPGLEAKTTEPSVYTMSVQKTETGRIIKFYLGGACVGTQEVPITGPIYDGSSGITIGEAFDESGCLWSFEGNMYVIIMHRGALTSDEAMEMADSLMLDPTVWGRPRGGDGTVMGAEFEQEKTDLCLGLAIMHSDSRGGAYVSEIANEVPKTTTTSVNECLNDEFTATAVVALKSSTLGTKYVLLQPAFFVGVEDAMRNNPELQASDLKLNKIQAHTITVTRSRGITTIRYYVNGRYMTKVHEKLGRVGLSAAMASLLDRSLDPELAKKILPGMELYLWTVHHQVLTEPQVKRLAHRLVSDNHTRSWSWGSISAPPSHDKALKAKLIQKKDRAIDTKSKPKVQPLFLLRPEDPNQLTNLYRLLKNSTTVIRYYLEEIVFPTFMHFHTEKISASGEDLGGSLVFQRRIGFTGTPSDLLPMELGKCGFEKGTEAEIINTLTSLKKVKPVLITKRDWTTRYILEMIAHGDERLDQPLHALIDTGALVTSWSNLEVAIFLIEEGLDVDGVVFLGENDVKMIYEKKTGHVLRLEESTIPMNRRFTFYDQVHTTGTDIPHVENAVAVCTLGKDMTFRDYAQGVYRMRGIATGQRINILVVPEVNQLMETVLSQAKKTEVLNGLSVPGRQLEQIACWLYINQIDSERKQFNFLMQQDLSNVYRKHSFSELLRIVESNEMRENIVAVRQHISSFKESLDMQISTEIPIPRSFLALLQEKVEQHKACIVDVRSSNRVLERVAMVQYSSEDSGLAQEQEQEQEEEKEQEVKDDRQDLDITTTDIAYSRQSVEPDTWDIRMLANEDKCVSRTDEMQPADSIVPFYLASLFGVYKGQKLDLPTYVMLSHNFYKRSWVGPRRLKNMSLMLEWIPSLQGLVEDTRDLAMTPEVEEQAKHTLNFLWNSFARSGHLSSEKLQRLIFAAFGRMVTEEELLGVLKGRSALESKEALWKVLVGSMFRPLMQGRFFVAVTLQEAETLRRAIHASRSRPLLSSHFVDNDTTIAIRMVLTAENVGQGLIDRAHYFPDHTDTQLKQACSVLRFMDSQTYFGDEDLSLLVKSFQNNSDFTRLLYYEQLLKSRRRKRENWCDTPLGIAINVPSEFKYIETTALSILMDLAMEADAVAINESFSNFDLDGDHTLNPAEMFCALEWLGLDVNFEVIYHWMKAADTDGDMELSLKEFTEFIRQHRLSPTSRVVVSSQSPRLGRKFGSKLDAAQMRPPSPRPILTREQRVNRVAEVQKDLMKFLGTMHADVSLQQKERDQSVMETHNKLLLMYQEEEEAQFGPNPSINNDIIDYNFQRQNLPRYIEFHGQPDYAPEKDPRFKDKQHFVMEPQAFFLMKPIPCPDQETRINEYTITLNLRGNINLLFSVAQEEDDLEGELPPSLLFTDNAIQTSIPVADDATKLYINKSIETWTPLTVIMNCKEGIMTWYISGDLCGTIKDPKVFAFNGPYSILPNLGLTMFKGNRIRSNDVGIRFLSFARYAMEEAQVKEIHGQCGIWQCTRSCRDEPPNNPNDNLYCWNCGNRRLRKGVSPEINPDMNPTSPVYGITFVVVDNFQSKLIDYVKNKGHVFLMVFSPTNVGANSPVMTEWYKLAKFIGKTQMLAIATLNIDENELEEKFNLFLPADARHPPAFVLFRKDQTPVLFEEKEITLHSLLTFVANNVAGFDFGRYMAAWFKRYWEAQQLGERIQVMRSNLLQWMRRVSGSGESTAVSPLRYLSMYLSDLESFAPLRDTVIDSTPPDLKGTDYIIADDKKGAKHDSLELLQEFVDDASFKQAMMSTEEWAIIKKHKLNEIFREMICSLARQHPKNSGLFLSNFLISQPRVIDPLVKLTEIELVTVLNKQSMLQSEVIRSWPNVRKAVVNAPSLQATREQIYTHIRPLLERGLPVDASPYGYSILYMASAQGNFELVKYMYAHGANIHQMSKDTIMPIEIAASMGHLPIVTFLTQQGSYFGTSLHYACGTGQVIVSKFLLEQGVPVDLHIETTPLEIAVLHGHLPVVQVLLNSGANKERMLSTKLQRDHQLTATKQKNKKDKDATTADKYPRVVELAKRLGETSIYKFLSSSEEQKGMQMNMVAYVNDKLARGENVTLLPGMDVNAMDTHGWTPLMVAAITNDVPLAKALLELGASHQTRNDFGFSAMMWARWCESAEFIATLKEARGENSVALDTNDQEGLDHLMRTRDEAKGKNKEVYALLSTQSFRTKRSTLHAETMNHAGSSFEKKQLDETGPQYSSYVVEETDVPKVGLEEFLRSLSAGGDETFPGGGWRNDIESFLNSCKQFVQNLVASRRCPSSLSPLDIFALHVYTRSDCSYFATLNRALRDNNGTEINRWRPFSWSISMSLNRLRASSGVYFRGVRSLFKHVDKRKYLPGEIVPWGAFTSSSRDLRVAANFMYGDASQEVAGVVFKIWGASPISLQLFSFFPQEQEYLFAPNSMFKVRCPISNICRRQSSVFNFFFYCHKMEPESFASITFLFTHFLFYFFFPLCFLCRC